MIPLVIRVSKGLLWSNRVLCDKYININAKPSTVMNKIILSSNGTKLFKQTEINKIQESKIQIIKKIIGNKAW